MAAPQTDYNIPKDGYVAFDAMSLRELIIRRLNEQNVFTDQNFIGSNLASIIDIVAYSYNTLIYYLNKTSTESMFTEAQLYENMNRIVKLVDYNPIGYQTSTLSFNASAVDLLQGFYTIPRYSYIVANTTTFTFNEDITFAKTADYTLESLNELAQQKLLYQGIFFEYPLYTAAGENNELLIVDTANELVDHFNIHVYVKPVSTGRWVEYKKAVNLYLEDGFSEKFELRLNGNNRYEVKFGNDINGKKLNTGDKVAVYYLKSNGPQGQVGPRTINTPNSTQLVSLRTPQFLEILSDVTQNQFRFLSDAELQRLYFSNENSSTYAQSREEAEEIRQSAPNNYRSQYRLVTTQDYENFIRANFGNIVSDVKVVNNWDYVSGYLRYYYDIGLNDPAKTGRALFNQLQYADSCNFNNVYLLLVPKSVESTLNYIVPAQKELISSSIMPTKTTTTELAFIDPIYKAVAFGVNINNFDYEDGGIDPCELVVTRRATSRRDSQAILNDVANVFKNYFSRQNVRLGQELNTRILTQEVLNIDGVQSILTRRFFEPTATVPGISLFVWNPLYPALDRQVVNNVLPGKYFEYLYFNDLNFIENSIKIVVPENINITAEF